MNKQTTYISQHSNEGDSLQYTKPDTWR